MAPLPDVGDSRFLQALAQCVVAVIDGQARDDKVVLSRPGDGFGECLLAEQLVTRVCCRTASQIREHLSTNDRREVLPIPPTPRYRMALPGRVIQDRQDVVAASGIRAARSLGASVESQQEDCDPVLTHRRGSRDCRVASTSSSGYGRPDVSVSGGYASSPAANGWTRS